MRIPRSSIKFLLSGIVLLMLFHFESLFVVGSLKISHLWKGLVLIYLSYNVFKVRNIDYLVYKPLILLAIFQLFNQDLFQSPFIAILNALILLLLPVMGLYILRFDTDQLKKALLFFSSFFILSFLPYQLGILSSIKTGYNLEAFGGTTGLIGPYQNPHGASIALSGALIVVLFFLFEGSFSRLYLAILFVIGFLFLSLTYVRTGLVMFLVGTIPVLFHYIRSNIRTMALVILAGVVMVLLVNVFVLSNDVLVNRIKGESKYNTEDSIDKLGSGRVHFWKVSLEIFEENDLLEKLFGIGNTGLMNRMEQKIGYKIGSHNAFLDILVMNGIFGLLLFFSYLWYISKFLLIGKTSLNVLLLALFLSFLLMSFLQGYNWLYLNLLLMLTIGAVNSQKKSDFYTTDLLE